MALRDQIRIMVVDDMSTSRGLIVQALEAMGIKNIDSAADGPSALTALAKKPVHLVISDFNMPGLDGLGLLHKLRTAPATAKVGFILITGRADRQMIETGQKLGMNNFIKKPFTPQDLKACIERVVGRL